MKLSWTADLKAESDLAGLSVSYSIETIPFSKIDLKESQYNGARLGDPIVNYLVEDYMTGMRNGCAFPRPVVHRGKAGFVILSGNQRCASIQRLISEGDLPKSTDIEAYLVATEDKLLLEIIARTGNVGHGGRSNKDERIAHAVYSVRSLGMSVKDAARMFMVSETTINLHIRVDAERRELESAGIDTAKLPASAIEPLANLTFDRGVKMKVATLVSQHSTPAERVKQVVGGLKKAKSTNERLKLVKSFEKELTEAAHSAASRNGHAKDTHLKVPTRPRRDRVLRDMKRLADYLDFGKDGQGFTSAADIQISTDTDKAALQELWKRLAFRFSMILKGA